MERIHISLRWFSDIGIPPAFSRTPGGKREPSQFAKFSPRLLDKVTSTVSKKLTENKTIHLLPLKGTVSRYCACTKL